MFVEFLTFFKMKFCLLWAYVQFITLYVKFLVRDIYLKRVLITEIKHEHVRCRASQSVITEVGPFQMRANREVRNSRQIGDL